MIKAADAKQITEYAKQRNHAEILQYGNLVLPEISKDIEYHAAKGGTSLRLDYYSIIRYLDRLGHPLTNTNIPRDVLQALEPLLKDNGYSLDVPNMFAPYTLTVSWV